MNIKDVNTLFSEFLPVRAFVRKFVSSHLCLPVSLAFVTLILVESMTISGPNIVASMVV